MSCCSRAMLALSHLLTLGSVALSIAALAQQSFIIGGFNAYNGSSYTYYMFSMGLFNSCLNGSCLGNNPFYWTWPLGRNSFAFYDQWRALQAFIIAEIVLRGASSLMMMTRSHWEQTYPSSVTKISKIMTGLHVSNVISGAIAASTFGSMPNRLVVDINPMWTGFGMSSVLQFIAFGIGVLGALAYGAHRYYAEPNKAIESLSPLLPGQQVTIMMHGQPMLATITPMQMPQSSLPILHVIPHQQTHQNQYYAPNPMAHHQHNSINHAHHVHTHQTPINQSINQSLNQGYVQQPAVMSYLPVQPMYYL